MFPLNNLLSTSNFPQELKIKIFSFLPVKTLVISRLVSPIWKTFIDTYFPEVFTHQFLSILQKYPIADQNKKNYLSQYAVKKIVANDFEKALELEKNLEGKFRIVETLEDLVKNADSKEKILKLFDLFLKKKEELDSYHFIESIQPLIERYFSIHASSLKKEKQEVIADNFNEALCVLRIFSIDPDTHLLIGLHLVDTYPEHVKNQQNGVFDSLKLKNNFFHYLTQRVVEKFSFSTFLNVLVIAKFFPEKYKQIPYFFERITTREDALALFRIGGRKAQKFIKCEEIYKHLNFFDLLQGAALLPEISGTYQFYRTILERAESAGEFEIGLQKLLERKPIEERLKEYHRRIVSTILNETPPQYLSFGVYEMLLHYPDSALFAKAFLRIAFVCEKSLRKEIVDRVKRVETLDDDRRSDIMALEIEMEEFEQAKQTFCSIKDPQMKGKAAARLDFFIEKEDWDHFDAFFKELHAFFSQESVNETFNETFGELIQQLAKKDAKRALNLVKSYWTGYPLAAYLCIIAKEQKKQQADFLPLVFEARSLITSLVTSNEDASKALYLLKELLELQS